MSSSKSRREPWRNQERHYCAVCNAWMGSDKQSILLHENGKKHQLAVEESAMQKQKERAAQDKAARQVQEAMAQMNQYAAAATSTTVPPQHNYPYNAYNPPTTYVVSSFVPQPTSAAPPPRPSASQPGSKKVEKKEWQERKRQRQETKQRKRGGDGDDDDESSDERENSQLSKEIAAIRDRIDRGEGYYQFTASASGVTLEKSEQDETKATDENDANNSSSITSVVTYLEGPTFFNVLEEDMRIQFWTGSQLAGLAERRLPERAMYWKEGIVAAIRKQRKRQRSHTEIKQENDVAATAVETRDNNESTELEMVVDVSSLKDSSDNDETLEKSVSLDRIRIQLGADPECIPETIEEARILALDGEEMDVEQPAGGAAATTGGSNADEIDEATGLSGWSTIKIKRTSTLLERKQERARLRAQRREAAIKQALAVQELEKRKMEQAAVANADDSALGAYDVYSRGTVTGYKGVDIHSEAIVEVSDLYNSNLPSKKQALTGDENGQPERAVTFKKTTFKAKQKKQNRRTTSADDD